MEINLHFDAFFTDSLLIFGITHSYLTNYIRLVLLLEKVNMLANEANKH